jgi:nitrogen fixation NifU-like protein
VSLDELYPKPILRLAAAAEGATRLSAPDITVIRVNPMCGDKITLDLQIRDEWIAALGYEVKACVLCQASASALAARVPGMSTIDAMDLHAAVKAMLDRSSEAPSGFGPLTAVQPHKSRHACVLLPLDALIEGLEKMSADA